MYPQPPRTAGMRRAERCGWWLATIRPAHRKLKTGKPTWPSTERPARGWWTRLLRNLADSWNPLRFSLSLLKGSTTRSQPCLSSGGRPPQPRTARAASQEGGAQLPARSAARRAAPPPPSRGPDPAGRPCRLIPSGPSREPTKRPPHPPNLTVKGTSSTLPTE